jgi:hypothetical protein
MTPKEKAEELCKKYLELSKNQFYQLKYLDHSNFHKLAAHLAVDEIIKSNPINFDENENCIASNWWEQVKQEITKL